MTNVTIKLTSLDSRILDDSVRKVVASVPVETFASSTLEVLPVEVSEGGRVFARKLVLESANAKAVDALAKIDLPHIVNIFIR